MNSAAGQLTATPSDLNRAGKPSFLRGLILGAAAMFTLVLLAKSIWPGDAPTHSPTGGSSIGFWPWLAGLSLLAMVSSLVLLFYLQKRWADSYAEVSRRLESSSNEMRLLRSRLHSDNSEWRDTRHGFEQQCKDLEDRVAALMRRNAALSDELNERRRAELSLSIQREELVRSKDVLELHVKARTLEVQKLRRRNELILNAAGEGICGLAPDGTIAFANPAVARITGWPMEELTGNSAENVFGVAIAQDAANANGAPMEQTGSFRRKDQSSYLSEFVYTPIDEGGTLVGYVMIFRDVTARRRAEQALSEKAEELTRSNAELEQFAFVASHDLQEPLRKILAFGDRLKSKVDAAKLTEGRDYLERMQNAAARMQTLIADLLTFSRVISRSQPFSLVDLNVVTKEVLNDLEVRIERSKARVEVGELPTIEADSTQLRQLIQNLLSNALKFHAPGAVPCVQIRARLFSSAEIGGRTGFIAKGANDSGHGSPDFCELTVTDNGIGFDEKYLEKMFAVFQRLHGRQEYEGTGIGLAVCRRIAERHTGSITAKGKPGEGATFIVKLPLRQPKKQEAMA